MLIIPANGTPVPVQNLSDDGLLKISCAFVVAALFAFVLVLFPGSAAADPLAPGSTLQAGDHRAPQPVLAAPSLHASTMSPKPPLAKARAQRAAGSAVILSYLLGVRAYTPPSVRPASVQAPPASMPKPVVIHTRADTRSDQTALALQSLEDWRWAR